VAYRNGPLEMTEDRSRTGMRFVVTAAGKSVKVLDPTSRDPTRGADDIGDAINSKSRDSPDIASPSRQ
jgi:hypothetical protein